MSSTPPPPEHDLGEPVVRGGRLLDARVRRGQRVQRGRRLGRAAGLHQRHRGERGQRAEQRHLVAAERAARAVASEQHPDELAVDQQRRAADRDQPLLADGGVDLAGVPVALVGGVVGGPVRAPGLRDEPAEPGPGGSRSVWNRAETEPAVARM